MAPDEILLGVARALRAAGVPVSSDRAQSFLQAASVVGVDDRRATYWAGRATLCSEPEDLDRYDQVFDAWFLSEDRPRRARRQTPDRRVVQARLEEPSGSGEGEDEGTDESQ